MRLERMPSAFGESGKKGNFSRKKVNPVPSVTALPKLSAPLKSVLKAPTSQAMFLQKARNTNSVSTSRDQKKKAVSFGGSQVKIYS